VQHHLSSPDILLILRTTLSVIPFAVIFLLALFSLFIFFTI
jgi:hypothetical protein